MTDTLTRPPVENKVAPPEVHIQMQYGLNYELPKDAPLRTPEQVAEGFPLGLDASLRAIVECSPGEGRESVALYVFDRGENAPTGTLARTNGKVNAFLPGEQRYLIITNHGLGKLYDASSNNWNISHEGWMSVEASGGQVTFGRNDQTAEDFGQEINDKISRNQVQFTFGSDGTITVKDENSLNHTKLMTKKEAPIVGQSPEELTDLEADTVPRSRLVGTLAAQNHVEVQKPVKPEVMIDGTKFTFEGILMDGDRPMSVISSVDSQGKHRRMLAYRSGSEGGIRVSQGFERDNNGRIMKGMEIGPWHQYTQDTQLHPAFHEFVRDNGNKVNFGGMAVESISAEGFRFNAAEAHALRQDFTEQIGVEPFGSKKLQSLLLQLRTGLQTPEGALKDMGPGRGKRSNTEQGIWKRYEKLIGQVNRELENSGIMPDFSQPVWVQRDAHPTLGWVTREVFQKDYNGRRHEWHISHDSKGRVWIDRIRFADSKATAYGTDQNMPHSGILTSKPIEYAHQVTLLPEHLKNGQVGGMYEDISPFLDTLAPIKRYREQRGITRQ